ncbi:MAG: family N-acetyltransferase [Aeromicrobium sp.]|jgi:mycothiol synthase|nr:family N-acetyltransferase [Aeromicrobium sp.]
MLGMELVLPVGMESRPLAMADVDAVTALLIACEQHYFGEAFVDRADIASAWSSPGIDVATDTRGVVEAGQLVGVVELDQHRLNVDVRPTHLGRGLGEAMLEWGESLARERGITDVTQEIPGPDLTAATILTSRGYVHSYTSWILRMPAGTPLIHHSVPDDVTIRGFKPADAEPVHRAIEDAFSGWPGRSRRSFEEWRIQNLERDGTDPAHFFVATVGDDVVGACVVHDNETTAWVHQVAVADDRRGQGIGQELLAEAFEAGRRRGLLVGELSTDTRTGAVGLYERLGMRIVVEFTNWRKDLS